MISRFFITLIFVFYVSNLLAQSPVFQHFTTDDGLPSSEVYFIIQDKKGYIWFATDMGVSRFDGYSFKNFDTQSGLPSNTIFEIYEDYKGRIWFSSFSGELSYFYNDTIIQYPYNDKLTAQFTQSPLVVKGSFFVDTLDKVTMGLFNQGIFDAFPDGRIINRYSKNIISDVVHLIVDNKNEKSYVLTYYFQNSEKDKFSDYSFLGILKNDELFRFDNDIFVDEKGSRSCLVKKDNGNYVYAFANYVYEFKNSNLIFKKKMADRVFSLGMDKHNNLYVGLINRGVYIYKHGDISKPHFANYLNNNSIAYVLLDNEGGYWIATLENGVFYMGSSFYKTYNKESGFASNNTECIVVDKDNDIWVGTNDNYINLISSDSIIKVPVSSYPNIIIKALCIDNDILWIGTNTYLYNIPNIYHQKKLFSKTGHFIIKENYPTFSTKEFKKSKNKGVWMGTSNKLYKLVDNKAVFPGNQINDYTNRTEAIYELTNGDVLLGTLNGLYKFVLKDEKNIKGDFVYCGEKNELLKNRILDIVFCDYNNKFWFATKGDGILVYSEDTVIQITKANGLTSNSTTSIFSKDSVIWAGTNHGLNKITLTDNNPLKYKIENITVYNGLASNEVRDIHVSDSMVYVATKSGLTVFENKKYPYHKISLPVYITNVSIKGRDTLVKDSYNLPYNKNSITIDFLGISYKYKGKLTYKHKLTGIDEDWVISNKTQAQYPFLPSGSYTFTVYAKSKNGDWSIKSAEIKIDISKPFWMELWFYSLIIFLLGVCVWAITFYRMKERGKRDKLLKKALSYQQLALSNQMDPHFLSNILNSIQKFIMDNDKILSSKYLSKFSDLMRKTLEASKRNKITLDKEIELLELYLDFERLRLKNKFNYEFIIDEKINTEIVCIPIFLLQPLVENSIWHGFSQKEDKCTLSLSIKLNKKTIICEIQDNGIGRANAAKYHRVFKKDHKTTGILNIHKRLKLISMLENRETGLHIDDLTDEKGNSAGTKNTIILPLNTTSSMVIDI